LEAFVTESDRGFIEYAGAQTFTVTTDSFITLVTRTYHTVCAADKEFSRFVSLTMYQYYNILHFWARIAAIREHRGMANKEKRNLVRYLKSNEYIVHETINSYLRGIGDFEDPSGTKHQFRLMRLPGMQEYEGISGFFGRVGADTHFLYESLPAPGIVALRLLQDLGYTRHIFDYPDWDLPDALCPEQLAPEPAVEEPDEEDDQEESDPALEQADDGPHHREELEPTGEPRRPRLTANLLGWSPAERLSNEQRQALEDCGLGEEFPTDYPRFMLNNGLFENIAVRVKQSADRYKLGASLHEHSEGSIAQCAYVEKETDGRRFCRTVQYSEGSVRGACAYQMDQRLSVAARIVAYRMRKEPDGNRQPWCCYDFNNYRDVPPDWIATKDSVFEYGRVERITLEINTYHEQLQFLKKVAEDRETVSSLQ
jgi:hypothetical protein